MEDDDFLAAVEADNASETVTEPAPEPVVEAPPAPEVTEQPAPAEQPVNPLEAPVLDVKPEPGFVPLSAVLDERDRRQRLERELEQMRSQQPAPQAQQIPDMLDDPDGYANYQANAVQMATLNVKLDLAEDFARQHLGDERVDKARDWALEQFQKRPGFRDEAFAQRNPYSYIVQQFEREQIASSVTVDDFAQFQAWKAAQATVTQQQQPAATAAPPAPSIPPRSLASAPSAGGANAEVVQSDQEVFEEMFTRK